MWAIWIMAAATGLLRPDCRCGHPYGKHEARGLFWGLLPGVPPPLEPCRAKLRWWRGRCGCLDYMPPAEMDRKLAQMVQDHR